MAASCVLAGPHGGQFDIRYQLTADCISSNHTLRPEDASKIAIHAVDCSTWSEGEPKEYRLRQIASCVEDALPRGPN